MSRDRDSRKADIMAENETPKSEETIDKPAETTELEEELEKVSGGGNYNCGCGASV